MIYFINSIQEYRIFGSTLLKGVDAEIDHVSKEITISSSVALLPKEEYFAVIFHEIGHDKTCLYGAGLDAQLAADHFAAKQVSAKAMISVLRKMLSDENINAPEIKKRINSLKRLQS